MDHSNQKEWEGYDDYSVYEREVIIVLRELICSWKQDLLQHLFLRNRSLNNIFKQI